jgi:uncharacterized membrane protein YkvA (DUF1232 family)
VSNDKKPPRGFFMFRREAEKLVKNPEDLAKTIDAARQKLDVKSGSMKELKGELFRLLRMIKAYGQGDYKKIPWKTLVTGVGAILYFLNPLDLVPDFLFGIGLVDDATVLAFCLGALKGDLDAFGRWEDKKEVESHT